MAKTNHLTFDDIEFIMQMLEKQKTSTTDILESRSHCWKSFSVMISRSHFFFSSLAFSLHAYVSALISFKCRTHICKVKPPQKGLPILLT